MLKQYLQIFTHDQQDEWVRWLPMAEYAYNSTAAIHGYSPFRLLYGFDPRTIYVNNDEVRSPAAEEWLDCMVAVYNQIHDILKRINDRRSKLSMEKSREYAIGDKVLVDRRNLHIKEGNRALSKKWIGPYTVTEVISRHSYRLNISKRNRLHHTALLKPFHTRFAPQLVDDIEDEEIKYDMERIIDS